MGSGAIARVGRLAAAVLVSGASLVCGPAVRTTTLPQLEIGAGAPGTDTALSTVAAVAEAPSWLAPAGLDQWFEPGGRNMGTEGIAMFLAAVALRDNAPLYISEVHGRTWGRSTSDHHISRDDSWAVDVAVLGIQHPTPQTQLAAKRISAALGVRDWPGGDLRVTVGNYRIQVLWLTPGHYNHVHVGVRRIS